jgi:hypothetical protein
LLAICLTSVLSLKKVNIRNTDKNGGEDSEITEYVFDSEAEIPEWLINGETGPPEVIESPNEVRERRTLDRP